VKLPSALCVLSSQNKLSVWTIKIWNQRRYEHCLTSVPWSTRPQLLLRC